MASTHDAAVLAAKGPVTMHYANAYFWRKTAERYRQYFTGKRVYEFGSYNVNDAEDIPRSLTANCSYTGIDWRDGKNVDVVCLAHEFHSDEEADAIFSASMFEHDPYWELSLSNMVYHLKDGGLMVITWGAALNPPHCYEEAPDQGFHSLPAGPVIKKLRTLGMNIQQFRYEHNLLPKGWTHLGEWAGDDGWGEVVLVAVKGKLLGEPEIDELLPEDDL